MAHSSSPPMAAQRSDVLRPNQLRTVHTTVFIVSSQAPLTVLAGVVTTMFAVTGIIAVPWAFVAVAAVLAVFLPGFLAISRHIVNPGAFYAVIAQGLSRSVALAAGPIALVAYYALQVGLYGIFGPYVAGLVSGWTGAHITTLQAQLAAWLIVLVSGLFRVKITGWFVTALVGCEAVLVVVLDLVFGAHPHDGRAQWATLNPGHLLGGANGGAGSLLCIAFLGFVGIELGAVLQSETRHRTTAVARGSAAALLVIAVLYAATPWLMGWTAGDTHLVARARTEQQNLLFNLARPYVGDTVIDVANLLFATSLLIALITFAMTCSRYTFALAREGWLPRRLGEASRAHGVPAAAALLQAAIGLAAILLWYVAGWDPLVTLFYYGGTFGGFSVMVLFALASLAVVVYFRRTHHHETLLVRTVLPTVAFLALAGMITLAVVNYATMLGVAPDDPLRWILPAIPFGLLVLLVPVGWVLKQANPSAWRRIGLGVDAETGLTTREAMDA